MVEPRDANQNRGRTNEVSSDVIRKFDNEDEEAFHDDGDAAYNAVFGRNIPPSKNRILYTSRKALEEQLMKERRNKYLLFASMMIVLIICTSTIFSQNRLIRLNAGGASSRNGERGNGNNNYDDALVADDVMSVNDVDGGNIDGFDRGNNDNGVSNGRYDDELNYENENEVDTINDNLDGQFGFSDGSEQESNQFSASFDDEKATKNEPSSSSSSTGGSDEDEPISNNDSSSKENDNDTDNEDIDMDNDEDNGMDNDEEDNDEDNGMDNDEEDDDEDNDDENNNTVEFEDVEVDTKVLEERFGNVDEPFKRGGTDLPLLFYIPGTGAALQEQLLLKCHGLVAASGREALGGTYDDELSLEIVTTPANERFINVDLRSQEGIDRAIKLDFIGAKRTDVVFALNINAVSKIFQPPYHGKCFALFRDPLEREMELFESLKASPHETSYKKEFSNMSFADFVFSEYAESNWLTRMITNKLSGPVDENDLEDAKDFLQTKCLVGLTNEFSESYHRFVKYFAWQSTTDLDCEAQLKENHNKQYHQKQNNNRKLLLDDISEDVMEQLTKQNQLDMDLYEYARKIYEDQSVFFE